MDATKAEYSSSDANVVPVYEPSWVGRFCLPGLVDFLLLVCLCVAGKYCIYVKIYVEMSFILPDETVLSFTRVRGLSVWMKMVRIFIRPSVRPNKYEHLFG